MSQIPRLGFTTERACVCLLSACCLFVYAPVAGRSQATGVPRFQDFSVASVYSGPVRPPDFGNPDQYVGTDIRCFGGDPQEYAGNRVNFAGHFVIGTCTCGSGCHYLFLWDAQTGKFYRKFPFGPINVGPYSGSGAPIEYKGEEYRADSGLLVVNGCFEEKCSCATRYYRWLGTEFRLVATRPVRKPAGCPAP